MSAHVLVVDDEKLIRWSLSERLTRNGYRVASAESGEEALQRLAEDPFDILLQDVRLPGIDGIETLKRALAMQPQLAVVMMSAHSTVEIAVEGMKHGAIDFLVKPFPFSTLDAVVRRAADAVATRRTIETGDCPARTTGCLGTCAVGSSPAIAQVNELVARVAASDSTVLIEGESGAGKQILARCIHYRSGRAQGPFVPVSGATAGEELVAGDKPAHDSSADGHAADGLFASAAGGTVMLDEIADLPPAGQARLLRLLEERAFPRPGGAPGAAADFRLIATTAVDLEKRVADGRFRADLFFRLNVVRIRVPALRQRLDDVPSLAALFIARFNQQFQRHVRGIAPAAVELLKAQSWPGNIRELGNVIERAFILHADMEMIRVEHLPPAPANPVIPLSIVPSQAGQDQLVPLERMERQLIIDALRRANGNQSLAARLLEISRDTLRYRIKKHALEATDTAPETRSAG